MPIERFVAATDQPRPKAKELAIATVQKIVNDIRAEKDYNEARVLLAGLTWANREFD